MTKAGHNHFGGWWLLGIGLFQVFALPVGILHEFGHLVAGRLAGLDVLQIVVGKGKTLWTGRIGSTRLALNAIQSIPYTVAGSTERKYAKTRRVVFSLGGVAANALFAGVGIALLGLIDMKASPYLGCFVYAFVFANGFSAVGNLIPFQVAGPLGPMASDGLALLRVVGANSATRDSWIEGYVAMGWRMARDEGRYEDSTGWCEKGLNCVPNSWIIKNHLAISMIYLERFDEARAILVELLNRPELNERGKLWLKNSIAFLAIHTERKELLGEADAYSLETLESIPWESSFKSTRGAVLVSLGKSAEAIPLLQDSIKAQPDDRNRAITTSVLAVALWNEGRLADAQMELRRVRELDSGCYLLKYASAHLERRVVTPGDRATTFATQPA